MHFVIWFIDPYLFYCVVQVIKKILRAWTNRILQKYSVEKTDT